MVCFSFELLCPQVCATAADGGVECGYVWSTLGDDSACDCGPCSGDQEVCVGNHCTCQPDCGGKECGSDGCGGTCGQCQEGQTCGNDGQCGPCQFCASPCDTFEVFGYCFPKPPACAEDADCEAYPGWCDLPTGYCHSSLGCACASNEDCSGGLCFEDLGGQCGVCLPFPAPCWSNQDCPSNAYCFLCGEDDSLCSDLLEAPGYCQPYCCGPCAKCTDGQVCFQDTCCTPGCAGKECGDDGCGGSCGVCPSECATHDQCGAGQICLGEPEGWPPMEVCGICGDVEDCHCAAPLWQESYTCTTDAECEQNLMCGDQCDDCPVTCPKCIHGWCAYETFDVVECLCTGCA